MKPEETIDFHVRRLWLKIYRLYNCEAAKSGGTMSVGYILLNIDREGTPSTKLGPKMGVESRSLTRTLKSMEEGGLIERVPGDRDKRVVLVRLTDQGKTYRDTSREVVVALNSFLNDNLTSAERVGFISVARKISGLLDDQGIFSPSPLNGEELSAKNLRKSQQIANHEQKKN